MDVVAAVDVVLAHQGWDELVLFGVPVVVAIVAVRWAERRVTARRAAAEAAEPTAADHDDPGDG